MHLARNILSEYGPNAVKLFWHFPQKSNWKIWNKNNYLNKLYWFFFFILLVYFNYDSNDRCHNNKTIEIRKLIFFSIWSSNEIPILLQKIKQILLIFFRELSTKIRNSIYPPHFLFHSFSISISIRLAILNCMTMMSIWLCK